MKLRDGGLVVTDQVDKNFIADLLVLLVILVVVVGGFAFLHTPSILLGGGLALVVAVAAEFAWSRQGENNAGYHGKGAGVSVVNVHKCHGRVPSVRLEFFR